MDNRRRRLPRARPHRAWGLTVIGLACAIALAGAAPSALAAKSGSKKKKDTTVHIGFVTELTGLQAESRKPFDDGVVSYFRKYPVAGNARIKYHIYDDQSNPAVAPAVFRDALSAKPAALMSFALSTSTAAAAPLIAQSKIPCICEGGPDNWYTSPRYGWAFAPDSDALQRAQSYQLVAKKLLGGSLKGKSIAISGDNTTEMTTIEGDLKNLAAKNGWTIAGQPQFGDQTEVSWTSEAATIAASKPDAVIVLTVGAPQIVQIKALESAGLTKIPIIAFPGLQRSDITSLKLPNVDVVTAYPYGTAPSTGVYQAAKQYGYLPYEVSFEFELGWTDAAVLSHAIADCGGCSGKKLETALDHVSNYTVPGGAAFAPITITAAHRAVSLPEEIISWSNAKHNIVSHGMVYPPGAAKS